MIQITILALVSAGLAAFMANRLYVMFTEKQITVKGIVYSLERLPIGFWCIAAMATFGLLAGLILLGLSILVITTSFLMIPTS